MFENSPKIEFLSQMQAKNGWYIEKEGLQKGYLRCFKFCFFDQKNFKNHFFLEKWSQNQKVFKIFKKTEYML